MRDARFSARPQPGSQSPARRSARGRLILAAGAAAALIAAPGSPGSELPSPTGTVSLGLGKRRRAPCREGVLMSWKTQIKGRAKSTAELGRMRLRSVQIQAPPKAVPTAAARLAVAGAGAGVCRRKELARQEKTETKRAARMARWQAKRKDEQDDRNTTRPGR
jgi:hypothetical protein